MKNNTSYNSTIALGLVGLGFWIGCLMIKGAIMIAKDPYILLGD